MTTRPVIRLEPDEDWNSRLRALSTIDGSPTLEVRWWEQGKCLAIWQRRDREGCLTDEWYPRKPLMSPGNWPRQMDQEDLEEMAAMLKAVRERSTAPNSAAEWWGGVKKRNAAKDAASLEQFHDDQEQIGKMAGEMDRRGYCWHGIRRDVDCRDCQVGQAAAEGRFG